MQIYLYELFALCSAMNESEILANKHQPLNHKILEKIIDYFDFNNALKNLYASNYLQKNIYTFIFEGNCPCVIMLCLKNLFISLKIERLLFLSSKTTLKTYEIII